MIRKACMRDVPEIHKLINEFAEKGIMLPRSLGRLYDDLRDFYIFEQDGHVGGTVAVHFIWDGLAEIRSLAVRESLQGHGVGRQLVERGIEDARSFDCARAFTLTYVPGFFQKLGFHQIDKSGLPHKIWADCVNCPKFPNCDEIALVLDLK